MNNKTDWVPRAIQGDAEAFQELMHEEKEKLYKLAYVYMRNEADALEVFQETVYKAFLSISTLRKEQYFSTWVTRILIYTAIAQLKKKQKIIPFSPELLMEYETSPAAGGHEEQLDLLEAMDQLEEKYKTVLLLRYYKDYSVKQIAGMLDCPEGTVKTHIHRGLTELKKRLKGAYYDDRTDSLI
ncbi:sigma-70 family RNA polymerase sigma factor [Paenibacillus donghaensis]|uniref:RNA polymerase subunit sigma-70 n=1 Tax=Paenibacillus donghaensis TaxID=414771 RepID=A0A2Z2KDB7_9BACL|nr:sigma-70 family RNA polymerase sigma factor [Paenibacillus donghaensis]ASA24716.1 RNA polymerase subunit sigma-70 [Paenibacillus donghaensis]